MTPSSYSTAFASDAAAQRLYQDLLAAGETDRGLDQGFSSVSYTSARRGPVQGASDRRLESAELFERMIASSNHSAAYQRFAGEALPWQASGNASSLAVLRRFDADIAAWRRDHQLPSGVNRALAQHIFNWVSSSSGLGLRIVENEVERDIDQVFASQRGDCTESTKVLLSLLTRVGFNPFPVWVHVDSNGQEVQHIATGLVLGGQTVLLDPVYGGFNQAHQQFVRLSLREFLAWHWNNRALDLQSSNPQQALVLFNRARQIDPNNPHILLNQGMVRRDQLNDFARASGDFRAALRLDSSFDPAQFQLGNMAFDVGRGHELAGRSQQAEASYLQAETFFRQAIAGNVGQPSYRRNLVLTLIRLGRLRQAEPHFLALCRLDPHASDLGRLSGILRVAIPGRSRSL